MADGYAAPDGRFITEIGDHDACSMQARITLFEDDPAEGIRYKIHYKNLTAGSQAGFKNSRWFIFDDVQSLWIWDGDTLARIIFTDEAIAIQTSKDHPELWKVAPEDIVAKIKNS